MTITDLLNTKMYRGNQSFLARELKINRGTLIKYMRDKAGTFHLVIKRGDDLSLFTRVQA